MPRRFILLGLVCILLTGWLPVQAQDSRDRLTHVVQPGENLFRIALRYGLSTEALMAANGLTTPDLVIVGQTLVIPGRRAATSPDALASERATSPAANSTATGGGDLGIIDVEVEYAPLDSPPPDDLGIVAADAVPPPTSGTDSTLTDSPATSPSPAVDSSLVALDLGIIVPGAASWVHQPGIFSTGRPDVRVIYQRGQALGNDPHAFSTIGDCNSEPPFFLSKFDTGEYNLGQYAYLQPVIDHFAGSFNRDSATVWTGNHVWALFDPVWANPALCQPGETPLACEFRRQRPSVVLIRLGTNEAGSTARFEQHLRALIEYAIERGVIPVLGTKADRLEGSDHHNQLIRTLAHEYDVPLWDFGRVAATLPGGGLAADGFHMTYTAPDYTQPRALQTGHSVQNLTALIALDRVWRSAMQ